MQISEQHYAGGLRQARHAHATASVTMILAGRLEERVGALEETGRPLSIVVKPQGVEHSDLYAPGGVRTIQVQFAGDEYDRLIREGAPGLGLWRWLHAGPAAALMCRALMARRANAPEHAVHALIHDALAALEPASCARVAPRWLRRVRERIEDEVVPGVAALASANGVHPVYLARQYRAHYGCTITDTMRRRRVQRAADIIARANTTLSEAALMAGYYDQAHMCRAFRRELRLSPSFYRAAVRPNQGRSRRARSQGIEYEGQLEAHALDGRVT